MTFFEEASIFQQDNGKRGKSWHSSRKHLSSSRTMESVESHDILRGSIYLPAGQWKAWKVLAFFEEASIFLQWPAHSPDSNPIEQLWEVVFRNVERSRPGSLEATSCCIPVDTVLNLVHSTPMRCAAIIASKGHCTTY